VVDPAAAKGAAKVRRRTPAQRERRKLKEKVQRLEKKVAHFSACEKHLARAMEQLAAAKTQIDELNSAMHYLLSQPPHNGWFYDKVRFSYPLCPVFQCLWSVIITLFSHAEFRGVEQVGQSRECPVRWDQNSLWDARMSLGRTGRDGSYLAGSDEEAAGTVNKVIMRVKVAP
jgi:hypothetical protein